MKDANAFRWKLTVTNSTRLSPNMQRLTFEVEGREEFPGDTATAYLKLAFPLSSTASLGVKQRIKKLIGRDLFAIRSYTIRRYLPEDRLIEMDFVLHSHGGPAASWASQARQGDVIHANGPGPKKLVDESADWFLIVGDMTALPAIMGNIELLGDDAKGYILIEVLDDADTQNIAVPSGIELRWVVNPDPAVSAERMLAQIRALQWLEGDVNAWVAGELAMAMALRAYLKDEKNIERRQMYASSYWQFGCNDDEHRQSKLTDSAAATA